MSDEAKAKLRDVIKEGAKPELTPRVELKTEKTPKTEKVKNVCSKSTDVMHPITLATASDWVVPGSVIGDSIIASGVNSSFG